MLKSRVSSRGESEKHNRELADFKKSEQEFKQEISNLNSKLDDERRKNYRNENLLQLRGEYIKTLQNTDEVNKARVILLLKEIENLKVKLDKAKKFKIAVNEELDSLRFETHHQRSKNQQLNEELQQKDEKIKKYKSRKQQLKNVSYQD